MCVGGMGETGFVCLLTQTQGQNVSWCLYGLPVCTPNLTPSNSCFCGIPFGPRTSKRLDIPGKVSACPGNLNTCWDLIRPIVLQGQKQSPSRHDLPSLGTYSPKLSMGGAHSPASFLQPSHPEAHCSPVIAWPQSQAGYSASK